MRRVSLLIIIASFLLLNFTPPGDCPHGISLLPMYGGVKKCKMQIDADSVFLKACDKRFGDRKQASKYYVAKGWECFYQQKLDTAMFRFNQAWLLDSLNADTYWGMGNLEGVKKQYLESMPLFNQSIKLNPANAKVYESASASLGQLYLQTKNANFLNASVKYLKSAVKISPSDAHIYAELTAAYTYFTQKDSAKKYLKIADQLDPTAVNPHVRNNIAGQ